MKFQEGYYFNIREDWQQSFPLEYFNDKDIATPQKSDNIFSETALLIKTKNEQYSIDLGWYNHPNYKLNAQVIKNLDWDNPVEKVELKTFEDAIAWVKKWIKNIEEIEDKMFK